MEIKIRIIPIETRPLTIEEECMLEIRKNSYYPRGFRDDIDLRLKEIGFVDTTVINGKQEGKFSQTANIRDATPEEYIAWYCMQMRKATKKIQPYGMFVCRGCPKYKSDGTCAIYDIIPLKDVKIIIDVVAE